MPDAYADQGRYFPGMAAAEPGAPSPLAAPARTSRTPTERYRRWYTLIDGQLLRELRRQHHHWRL